jgi:hypothetical protein
MRLFHPISLTENDFPAVLNITTLPMFLLIRILKAGEYCKYQWDHEEGSDTVRHGPKPVTFQIPVRPSTA